MTNDSTTFARHDRDFSTIPAPSEDTELIGQTLAHYRITAAIGAGGMGEVFRATDTRLGRDVALKLLPKALASDPERLARFEREARLLASLNHPGIAHLYGFETATLEDGSTVHLIAMELVEGEELGARIARGAIPLDEAIAIAKQIAEALEEAHEKGIVHRDLKPANIKLTPDGKVKVLDFGLAKAWTGDGSGSASSPDASHSPTMTRQGTEAGIILGTAAYMSPEQARGKAVDKRADIWAFGVVVFEMLTGERLFAGDSVSDVLASVLKDTPRFGDLPASTPPRLRRLVERCLERDLRMRLRDIGEARVEIARMESGAPASGIGGVAPRTPAARSLAPFVVATAAAAVLATLAVTRWLVPHATPPSGPPAHVSIALPDGDDVGALPLQPVAISEDGTHLAYVGFRDGRTQIYLRTLSDSTPRALDGTEGGEAPFFSPDGEWVAFFAGTQLRKIAVGGAALQTLADAPFQRGGAWGADGYIYFAPTNATGIWRVPEGGGAASEVTKKDLAAGEISHRWPHLVAGSRTLLFALWTGPGDDEQNIAVQTLGEPGHHVLVKGGASPRYAARPGLLLYARLGELFAVPWRPSQTDLGRAVPMRLREQTNDGGLNEGGGSYTVSADGTLAYIAGGRARNASRLVWVDRAGKVTPAPLPERNYEGVAISPDGRRSIVQIRDSIIDLWMYDLGRSTLTPIGTDGGSRQSPVWTPDGARIIYRGTRQGFRNVYWRSADGAGDAERLTTKPDVVQSPSSVSPDGQWLVYNESGEGGTVHWVMKLEGDRTPRHLFPQPGGEMNAQISPDGRWMAFEAKVSSRPEVYVAPFPGPGPRQQVSTDGGAEPLWSRDGRELFYQNGTALMAASVTPGAALSVGPPHVLHEGRFAKSINNKTSWSVTPDGSRFLRIQQVEPERPVTRIDLVLNWFEELSGKAPAP